MRKYRKKLEKKYLEWSKKPVGTRILEFHIDKCKRGLNAGIKHRNISMDPARLLIIDSELIPHVIEDLLTLRTKIKFHEN